VAQVQLTILNSMAGTDFVQALDQHVQWGTSVLDLKDAIFGKAVADLTDDEAVRAAELIRERGLTVHCLSSGLFLDEVEAGEEHFRTQHLGRVPRLIEIARILQPRMIRLLAATTRRRAELPDCIPYLRSGHPWLLRFYAEAAQQIADAGFQATLENEVDGCIFSSPGEVIQFFSEPGMEALCFTWDAQNMWQLGTFPTLEVYAALKMGTGNPVSSLSETGACPHFQRPLLAYFHLKGGQHDGASTALRWATALEDASWPVLEVTRQVVADGVSPVICLNPSHGARKEGYDYADIVRRDLEFIRRNVEGVQ
jgi:hypothetical protein